MPLPVILHYWMKLFLKYVDIVGVCMCMSVVCTSVCVCVFLFWSDFDW